MRRFTVLIAAVALSAAVVQPTFAAKPPDTWDGLMLVKSKKIQLVYLLPNADFRGYTKVMLDPTQVAFRKNWQRDQNRETADLSSRVSDKEARAILDEAQSRFQTMFADAYRKAGYEIVTQPGEDVLRVATAIVNLDVEAPDTMSAGRTRTYSREAGAATYVVEAKDSLTGQVLGRAVDPRSTGDFGPYIRNRVTNIAEFEQLFSRWASRSADGINELKALSPIDANGALKR